MKINMIFSSSSLFFFFVCFWGRGRVIENFDVTSEREMKKGRVVCNWYSCQFSFLAVLIFTFGSSHAISLVYELNWNNCLHLVKLCHKSWCVAVPSSSANSAATRLRVDRDGPTQLSGWRFDNVIRFAQPRDEQQKVSLYQSTRRGFQFDPHQHLPPSLFL